MTAPALGAAAAFPALAALPAVGAFAFAVEAFVLPGAGLAGLTALEDLGAGAGFDAFAAAGAFGALAARLLGALAPAVAADAEAFRFGAILCDTK